ncbi:MAG: glycerophosphodiester phosphodiesterase [Bacteroidota bacterium]
MFDDLRKPLIFAHRGDSAHAPENTVPAFERAVQAGADGVELDVKLSADGEVIVSHDPTVDRTTGGHGRISQLTLTDLVRLDAGASFSEAFRGTRLPRLEEVFEAVGRKCLINVELTNVANPFDGVVEKVCALVKRHGLQSSILFSSFFGNQLRTAARLLPEVPRGLLALGGWKGAWARSFQFMFGDFQALHPNVKDVNPAQVSRVHRLSRRILVYTVNSAEEIARLSDWGVDGIFTDDPGMALRAAGRTE